MKKNKGFTLIEMLVVIGIIGLLASVVLVGLTSARKAGRDARRIADMRTIQNALELYYNRCGVYPGDSSCNPGNTSFNGMVSAIKGAGIGVSAIPGDPLGQGAFLYWYTSSGQEYIISAVLEDGSNRALADDFDAGFCADPRYCVGVVSDPNSIPSVILSPSSPSSPSS